MKASRGIEGIILIEENPCIETAKEKESSSQANKLRSTHTHLGISD